MNEIIDELDEAPLPSAAWSEVAYELIAIAGFNDAETLQMVEDYSKGALSAGHPTSTAAAIWAKVGSSELTKYEDAKIRLLTCLIPTGTPLDGYGAEYLFVWANDLGLAQNTVVASLHRRMR